MPSARATRTGSARWLLGARVAWPLAAAALTWGTAAAVDGRSASVRFTALIGACLAWGAVLVALIVPSTAALTAARMVGPLAAGAAVLAVLTGAGVAGVAAVAACGLGTATLFSAGVGDAFVQASAYGDERRNLLRPPAAALPPATLAWLLWAGCIVSGPLLLAARQWAAGGALTTAAAALGWLLVPRFHALSRRWLVTLPTGVVVHDQLVLAETVMAPRSTLRALHLALADTQAADVTGPAAGHALEVAVDPPATITLRAGRKGTKAIHAAAFLVAPTRPGAALRAAAEQRLPVG